MLKTVFIVRRAASRWLISISSGVFQKEMVDPNSNSALGQ